MTRLKPLLAALAVAALATACAQKNTGTNPKDSSVATVDGVAISRNTFEHYALGVASKPATDLTAEQRDRILEDLIRAQLTAAAAERDGVAASDDTRAKLDMNRLQILQRAQSEHYLKDRKPSEEELRAEYDIQIGMLDKVQYRVAHIQTATEAAARQILAQLKSGANFAQLVKTQSTDAATRDKGGELDWSIPSRMPEALGEVVRKLKKGETAPDPVKTQFGYHVVRVIDTRDSVPPTFDQARSSLVQIVEEKKFKAYVDGLQAKAKIVKAP
jgi:peptidyl-prolyl cis-trans isomerase C